MQMALGMFIFSIQTVAYQSLSKSTTWRHAKQSRVGVRDAYQYVGIGDTTVTLPGWIAPGQIGSSFALDMLEGMANTGKAFTLVDGLGIFHGVFVITGLKETHSHHNRFGQARKIEFELSLERIDEDDIDGMLGDLKLPSFGPGGTSIDEMLA